MLVRFRRLFRKSSNAEAEQAQLNQAASSKGTLAARVKQLILQYGKAAILLHMSASWICWLAIFLLLRFGMESYVEAFLNRLPFGASFTAKSEGSELLATALLAWLANKTLTPLRAVMTLACTPRFAVWLHKRWPRWFSLPAEPSAEPSPPVAAVEVPLLAEHRTS